MTGANASSMYDVGGIVGAVAVGLLSDRFRSPGIVTYASLLLAVPFLLAFNSVSSAEGERVSA